MSKHILLIAFLYFGLSPGICQSSICESGYLPFHNGASFTLTSFNKKGKVTSVVRHNVLEISESSDGFRAMVGMQIFDDKEKPLNESKYFIDCRESGLFLDMSSLLNPESFAALGSMQVDITGDALLIPNLLTPGQELPDAEMQIKASLSGMSLLTLTIAVTDRKVIAKERLTTPAGTFACVKLLQTTTIGGLGNRSYTGATWLAPSIGTVRSENYDKKGELDTYTELTEFTR